MALNGESLTGTVEGFERYTVNVCYPRAFRSVPRSVASEVTARLKAGIPLTLLIVFLPLYLNLRRMSDQGEDRHRRRASNRGRMPRRPGRP
ncbi:hypothetical protein MKK55_08535 [Methylobacterium sp. J-059]|nr:hypothetical protein [Methylobacterium sp. J-059]MCJ2038999.1 hypothetical protein [Methylobacterium sp. J-059]